jgi:2-oxoisovalerate dehydrogenase E1 component
LYRQGYAASAEPAADYVLPFGIAATRREGTDVTVITYGYLVQQSLEAARELEQKGISVEVIDLRTLNPLDDEAIYNSVKKTNRVVVAHEDTLTGGFGGEIVARITENCFSHLDAPVIRVAALDAFVPYSPPLEDVMLPNKAKIVAAIEKVHAF